MSIEHFEKSNHLVARVACDRGEAPGGGTGRGVGGVVTLRIQHTVQHLLGIELT